MKLDLADKEYAIREAYLARDEQLYREVFGSRFRCVKTWDEAGPEVVWQGMVEHPTLARQYEVQVRYGIGYPYRRPRVVPINPPLLNNRHQNPSVEGTCPPGDLCLFPHTPDYWAVGMTCVDVIERAVNWFGKYEAKTLDSDIAPPEIEVYFPASRHISKPIIILAESALKVDDRREGRGILVPTKSGRQAFLALTDGNTDVVVEEVFRLAGLILPNDGINSEKMESGRWFSIAGEPELPVPRTTSDLLNLISQGSHRAALIKELARSQPSFIAVCYPTPFSRLHWLIFKTTFTDTSRSGWRPHKFHLKLLNLNRRHEVSLYAAQHVSTEALFKRVSGYAVDVLQQKSCAVLGCGSIGSRVAETTFKSGIGEMTLVDKDVVKAGNPTRHVLGLNYLGQNKAFAMAEFLLTKNPFAKVFPAALDVIGSPRRVEEIIRRNSLIVSCLGNDAAESLINLTAVHVSKPVLYCRSYLAGRLGEIFFYDGGSGACFQCASDSLQSSPNMIPRPPTLPYEKLVRFDGDCGSAFIPASAVDLDFVALHGARLALSFMEHRPHVPMNYWLIRGRDFDAAEYPTLMNEIREPFRVHSYFIPRSGECATCGAKAG